MFVLEPAGSRASRTTTPSMVLPRVSKPTTSAKVRTCAPSFLAPSAKPQTKGQGKTTPSSGL